MSTMPWGTMNGWLRLETEQRGTWLQQRVQDLRAAQVATRTATQDGRAVQLPARTATPRRPAEDLGCPEAA
jgi:hypothetical protein